MPVLEILCSICTTYYTQHVDIIPANTNMFYAPASTDAGGI